MFFRQVFEEGLAQASYVVGDPEAGVALVVDPRRDIDVYLRIADDNELKIVAITETHIHADFLSGARELAAATGATLHLSDCGGEGWTYTVPSGTRVRRLRDRDRIDIGSVMVDVRHTPGHTPEHIMCLVTDGPVAPGPMVALTGDFIFVGDVGRPDLLESAVGVVGSAQTGARAMFASLRDVFSAVPDFVQIWPGHGAGSACGKALGAVPASTAGYERITAWWAPFVAAGDEDGFVRELLDGQPDAPTYFARMKRLNRDGMPLLGSLPRATRLDRISLRAALDGGATLIDTRGKDAFRSHHPKGALCILDESTFSTRTAWFVDPDRPIVVIARPERVETLVRELVRVGLDHFAGYVDAADTATLASLPAEALEIESVSDAFAHWKAGDAAVLDVRSDLEFKAGHVPGALHVPAGRLTRALDEIPRDKPLIVHCAGGSRSAAASSVLLAAGFSSVSDLVDGFEAWEEAGNPVETGTASPVAT